MRLQSDRSSEDLRSLTGNEIGAPGPDPLNRLKFPLTHAKSRESIIKPRHTATRQGPPLWPPPGYVFGSPAKFGVIHTPCLLYKRNIFPTRHHHNQNILSISPRVSNHKKSKMKPLIGQSSENGICRRLFRMVPCTICWRCGAAAPLNGYCYRCSAHNK
jgi:hypothetical protein